MCHQLCKSGSRAALEKIASRHAKSGHLVLRQVNAAAAGVLADVADDVGELEGDAQIARVVSRSRAGVAEDFRRQQPDDAGDVVAIVLERRKVEITVLLKIHAHSVDDGLEVRLRKVERG